MLNTAPAAVRWITRAEAAAHLRISPRQLDRMNLPRTYFIGGRSPRFNQADLDSAMSSSVVLPVTVSNVVPFGRPRRHTSKPVIGAILANDRKTWLQQMKRACAA